ncbi:unnamed protein product, partial [marine sediment metagenome]
MLILELKILSRYPPTHQEQYPRGGEVLLLLDRDKVGDKLS